jgi:addiction module HigA family antidote
VFLEEDVLDAYGLTQQQLAERLFVSRRMINEVINGRRALSPSLAVRLAKLTGYDAEYWLNLQSQHDLWHAERSEADDLARIEPLPPLE